MAGLSGISAYQQSNQINKGSERTYEPTSSKVASSNSSKESKTSKVETKGYTPIDTKSSLVPKTTEYGNTIGDVKLSDKAKDYYNQLKGKFHNMEFIAVSKDMKAQVQANAAAYGNANKIVVLIDEEKLERMATDESFRKKYEGIIAMSQTKMAEAKNSLTSSGASVKNFGMSVDSNGSACTSHDYSPSYVLKAMGLDEERLSEAIRISWGPKTVVEEMEKELNDLHSVAKGLAG